MVLVAKKIADGLRNRNPLPAKRHGLRRRRRRGRVRRGSRRWGRRGGWPRNGLEGWSTCARPPALTGQLADPLLCTDPTVTVWRAQLPGTICLDRYFPLALRVCALSTAFYSPGARVRRHDQPVPEGAARNGRKSTRTASLNLVGTPSRGKARPTKREAGLYRTAPFRGIRQASAARYARGLHCSTPLGYKGLVDRFIGRRVGRGPDVCR